MSISPSSAVFLALGALACQSLCAQEYNFRYFGLAEGLTNLAIRQIYQDRAGFIWVSTENGIFRYDGDRFEGFGPAQGIPATSGVVFGDAPDGSLLVGGDMGLYRQSGNRFEKVPLDAQRVGWAQSIQTDGHGRTLVGTENGLMELSLTSGRTVLSMRRIPPLPGASGTEVNAILVDGETTWYGCGLELCRIGGGTTAVMGPDSGLPAAAWQVIRKDGSGNLWLRGKNSGLYVLPRGQTRFHRPPPPVPQGMLVGIPSVDATGRMLLPSTAGLFTQGKSEWQRIDRSNGLRGTVYAAFEDRQHSLWIGVAGRGLARLRGYREWESYTTESGLSSDLVYEILPDSDGSVFVATEGGLFRGTRLKSGFSWKKMAGIGDDPVHTVRRAPDGDLWIGTETHGAARIHAGTGKVEWFGEKQGLSAKAPYTIRFDSRQQLWAATEAGLFVAEPPYLAFNRVEDLPSSRFWTIAEGTDGVLWVGGAGGLFAFTDRRWKNYAKALGVSGLNDREVIALAAGPEGRMWVGYRFGGGIDRIRLQPGGPIIEKGIQRPGNDGIAYFLEFDPSGRLWAGTEHGVDVWDGSHWSHYDTSDGLAWDDCDLNGFASEADGTVWIGTSGGLSRFRPDVARPAEFQPNIVFTKVGLGKTDVSGQVNPAASVKSNILTARYSVLNATHVNSVVFRYRMMPTDSGWTETTQRELEFADVAPGPHYLEVEARANDGAWSGHAVSFPFEILTPWYRTWWFIAACLLAPLLIAACAVRLRMTDAVRRERELRRLVDEKTRDLRRANQDLLRLSSTDPLTGLANRRVFNQRLAGECARVKRKGFEVSLLILDVDHFKTLNDTQGHQRGDTCLELVAAELSRLVRREVDTAARYGGEEFALILPDVSFSDALRFADQLRVAITSLGIPHPASPVLPVLTVSVGVATATNDRLTTPDELIFAADDALYRAKRSGRNRVLAAATEATADPQTCAVTR